MERFPTLRAECFDHGVAKQLQEPPRILILYGSVYTAVLQLKKLAAY